MKRGEHPGGKITTPIRELMKSEVFNGVIFICDSPEAAESTRLAALAVRRRNGFKELHTTRRADRIMVYKDDGDLDPATFEVNLKGI